MYNNLQSILVQSVTQCTRLVTLLRDSRNAGTRFNVVLLSTVVTDIMYKKMNKLGNT